MVKVPYVNAINGGLADHVDYSQVVNVYATGDDGREARYSSGEVTQVVKTPILGAPMTPQLHGARGTAKRFASPVVASGSHGSGKRVRDTLKNLGSGVLVWRWTGIWGPSNLPKNVVWIVGCSPYPNLLANSGGRIYDRKQDTKWVASIMG